MQRAPRRGAFILKLNNGRPGPGETARLVARDPAVRSLPARTGARSGAPCATPSHGIRRGLLYAQPARAVVLAPATVTGYMHGCLRPPASKTMTDGSRPARCSILLLPLFLVGPRVKVSK
jgi:hypothetical protein